MENQVIFTQNDFMQIGAEETSLAVSNYFSEIYTNH